MFHAGVAEPGLTEIIVDSRGHRCPVPTLRLRRACEAAPAGAILCLVTDDPERDWPAVREGERRRMAVYNQFRAVSGGHGGVSGITEEARIPQTWVVGSVEHCVAELAAFIREYGLKDIVTWAVPPGMRPDQIAPSLERFARDVAPRLRALFPG